MWYFAPAARSTVKKRITGGDMRVLGIDPGLATMGWSIVEGDHGKLHMVGCGVVTTPPDMAIPNRLHGIFTGVKELLETYKPDEIAFEELFFAHNVTTGINVAAARGAAICACAEYTPYIYEYTPMQIKQAVVGYGKADKHQVQHMVKLMLNLPDIPRPDDAADAVACALTHLNAGAMRSQFLMVK